MLTSNNIKQRERQKQDKMKLDPFYVYASHDIRDVNKSSKLDSSVKRRYMYREEHRWDEINTKVVNKFETESSLPKRICCSGAPVHRMFPSVYARFTSKHSGVPHGLRTSV